MAIRTLIAALHSAREKISRARDFFDSLAWRRLGQKQPTDHNSASTDEHHLFALELFLRPISWLFILLLLSFILEFLGKRAIDGAIIGVGFALAPVSSADLAYFSLLAIMALFLGGLKACVVVARHRSWMARRSPEILFLREERALKRVSRQAGALPQSKRGPSSRL